MASKLWKRTAEQETALRCAMVEGTFLEDAAQALIDQVGEERAGRQVPISGASNVIRRMLGVTAVLYERCAVTGLPQEMAELCGDASWLGWRRRLAAIGAAPMPTGLVEGGADGGLSDALEYLQAVGYVGVAIEWSYRAGRPQVVCAPPDDLEVTYLPDDRSAPAKVAWTRERTLEGQSYSITVQDVYDLTDLDAPSFRVMRAGVDVTTKVPALARAGGRLSGDGYPWRYADGNRPFIPIVIYGNPGRVMRGIAITEAALDGVVYRTSAKSAMIDAGFATREVSNLATGVDSDGSKTPASGTEASNQGPGDVRVWRRIHEEDATDHWSWAAAVDPEVMLRTAQAQERDAVSMLGFPVEFTATGGEPMAWEVAAQERAIRRWYDTCRMGDMVLLRRIAAVCNRQLGTAYPEKGYTVAYREEVDADLARAENPAPPNAKAA